MSAAAGGGVDDLFRELLDENRAASGLSLTPKGRRINEVRVAVAELIAVAQEAELVLAEKLRRLGADPNVSPTIHKLRAALSNIEGASHG